MDNVKKVKCGLCDGRGWRYIYFKADGVQKKCKKTCWLCNDTGLVTPSKPLQAFEKAMEKANEQPGVPVKF